MNSKKNRPKLETIAKQREAERRKVRKLLKELKAECYAPAIQMVLPFPDLPGPAKAIPVIRVKNHFAVLDGVLNDPGLDEKAKIFVNDNGNEIWRESMRIWEDQEKPFNQDF